MIRPLFLAALFLAASLAAQTASVTHYGSPCPNPNPNFATLTVQGLPRLGTTLTVTNIAPFRTCVPATTQPYVCTWPALVFGFSRGSTTVSLPGLNGHGCPILARPDHVLFGDANWEVRLQVPNRANLTGLRFYLQRVDLVWIGLRPPPPFVGVELSDGAECVIGR